MMRRISIFLLICVCLTGCHDESSVNHLGKIQLSYSKITNGRTKENDVPFSVMLSIQSEHGNMVYENTVFPLISFGGGYISENILLPVGEYSLTQFIVLNEDQSAIYATPVEDSPLSDFVNDPLPIWFSVTENNVTMVRPQVLPVTDESSPEEFGYVNFGFDIVNPQIMNLKEYEVFKLHYDELYKPEEKYVFHYADGLLKRKEHFVFLEPYNVYYLSSFEIYEQYDGSNRPTDVTLYNGVNNVISWRYKITYMSDAVVKWDWIDPGYDNYTDEIWFTYLYTRTGNDFVVDVIEFPGQPAQSELQFDGVFDGNNNVLNKRTYNPFSTPPIISDELKIATYDSHPNPLKNPHDFFKTENVIYLSQNNPLILRHETPDGEGFYQAVYSYDYNLAGYPLRGFVTETASGIPEEKRKIVFKYNP